MTPPIGPYWTACAPKGQPDFANMRQSYTENFDNATFDIDLAWERHRHWILPRYELLLHDPLIGNPPTKLIDGRQVSFGSIEFAAMASIILPHLEQVAWPYTLEIGGGYGGLAYALMSARHDMLYRIVDLKSVLECSRYYLQRTGLSARAKFLEPEPFERFYDGALPSLYIQTRGFMEMSPAEVESYFQRIQHQAPIGSLFFCLNKCSKREQDSRCQSRWVDYPWDDRWSIVVADHWIEKHPMPMVLLRRSAEPVAGSVETIRSLCD